MPKTTLHTQKRIGGEGSATGGAPSKSIITKSSPSTLGRVGVTPASKPSPSSVQRVGVTGPGSKGSGRMKKGC